MGAKSVKQEISGDSIEVLHEDIAKMFDMKKNHKVIRQMEKTTQWSNLPTDLLLEIMPELNLVDQIRFRFVCKPWLSLPLQQSSRPMDKLPWLVTCDDVYRDKHDRRKLQINCKLFDLIHEKPYTNFEINIGAVRDFKHPFTNIGAAKDFKQLFTYSKTSKHGWMFLAMQKVNRISFVLFAPFTKKIIKLPDLYQAHQNYKPKRITFSSDPTSKECVFFIVFHDQFGEIKVGTYKHGYKSWIITSESLGFSLLSGDVVCFQGNLYFYSQILQYLFIYNVAERYWKYINTSVIGHRDYLEHHLLESNGELLLVCINRGRDRCGIYTFDTSSQCGWVVKKKLHNRALFIGRNLITVPASGELKHMENKVFYYDNYRKKSKFYDLKDGTISYNCEGTEYECLFTKSDCWQKDLIDCPPQIIEKLHNQKPRNAAS